MASVQAPPAARPVATTARLRDAGWRGLIREHWWLLGVLAVCAFLPLAELIVFVGRHGGVLTGVNGADFFDQFQYLAFIRDAGSHVLASNLWVIGRTPHDYLHPMYLISGLLWRAGLSLQLAYVIWKPVALLVLFLGFGAYVRHTLTSGRWSRAAALALALFYASPALALQKWSPFLSAGHTYQLVLATDDPTSVATLWGFEHMAIAIGLMPVFLIACERALAGGRRRAWLLSAAAAGLLSSWLHPWQGLTLLVILVALAAVKAPRRRYAVLAAPALATAAPLLYSFILSHTDASWRAFSHSLTLTGTAPWWALLLSLGPLVAFAALGVRRPQSDREIMLLVWPLAVAAVYLLLPQFPPHALSGVTLPLAVLAVRGWRRARTLVRAPAIPAALAALAAALLVTAPALVSNMQDILESTAPTLGGAVAQAQFRLSADEASALRFLAADRRPGGVLAPWLLSLSVPAFTDRPVLAGHLTWEPAGTLAAASSFFATLADGPSAAGRRAIFVRSRARFVLAPCDTPPLRAVLAPVAAPVARFGCVTVYARR